jgi:hypothetical protein
MTWWATVIPPPRLGDEKEMWRSGDDTMREPPGSGLRAAEAVELRDDDLGVDLVKDGACFDGLGLSPDAQTAGHTVALEHPSRTRF